jgi:hypothetical protein
MSCHGPQTTQFKCVGCAQHNKTPWARHDRNVMPWATDNTVQVRGLCTTQQDTMGPARQKCHAMGHRQHSSSAWAVHKHMGPARQKCHAMGHRQHSSSAWAVHNTTRHHGPGTTEMSCHGPQTIQFKCVGCAQHNKTPWARHDRNVMPWATDNTVQVRGLCTTQQDTMGPARQKCHAMGHRQHSSSAWAVHNATRHHGPGTTAMSCHGPGTTEKTTMVKCVGGAEPHQTQHTHHRHAPCCPRRCV